MCKVLHSRLDRGFRPGLPALATAETPAENAHVTSAPIVGRRLDDLGPKLDPPAAAKNPRPDSTEL